MTTIDKIKITIKGSIFIAFYFLFFSCAQQSQPLSGGPKDTIPPKFISSKPALNDTSVISKKIIIKFNEFIQLKNIQSEFFSSPPLTNDPVFSVKRKKLIVKLKDTLIDSVTYNFNFGNAIVDFHESNPLKNFEFIFSTYDKIDTLQISGQIIDAFTLLPDKNFIIMLYPQNIDSLPYSTPPLYVSKTDSSGFFTIKNIKKGQYKIFALNDLNGNFIFDKDENKIAFSDTLIKPYFKIDTLVDTLDSGYVYLKNPTDTVPDTLRHDSIIINIKTHFYPDNIKLKSFKQLSQVPEIQNIIRDFKGRIKIFFTKPLPLDYLKIYYKNNELTENQLFIEATQGSDSVFLWILDSTLFNKDTLNLIAKFYDDETTQNILSDSILTNKYDYSTDTTLLYFEKDEENISIFNNFGLKFETPLISIDTEKIKLFKIIDTVVTDLKEQKVNSIRFLSDSLIFVFKRPISFFNIKFKNYDNNNIPFIWKINSTHDSVFVKIIDPTLSNRDTLKFNLFYDNIYFFNQIQSLSDSVILPLTKQKTIFIKRPTQDSIIIKFIKNISTDYNFSLINFNPQDYFTHINTNTLIIKLTSPQAINQDTILVSFKNPEKENPDTVKAIYVFDREKITFSRRYSRSNIIIAFHKPLLDNPQIKLLSFKTFGKWYSVNINQARDTIRIKITNQRVLRLNTMRLLVSYYDINHHQDTVYFNDTLNLPIVKAQTENTEAVANEQKITLHQPINFSITKDTDVYRNYFITAKYEAGQTYLLQIDSATFIDVFNRTNDTAEIKFNVYAPEEYAQLNIQIKNIWKVTDTNNIDTSKYYQLPQGQILLILSDANDKTILQTTLNSDQTLKTNYLIPDAYKLKAIYDKNSNGVWDTGDYLKHIQPEKVFLYNGTITLEKGETKKIIWDFNEK